MRVLAIYVSEDGTEWCRIFGGTVAGGLIPGDGLWAVIDMAFDDGLVGSYEDPLSIVVGGDIPPDHKVDLEHWEIYTPGVELSLYAGWETAGALRDARRATGPVAKTMRARGLLGPEAPTRHAAALALDMALSIERAREAAQSS